MEAIWKLYWEPRPLVHESIVRLVLMGMARFTNPNRDQVLGPSAEWRCWASVGTLAKLTGLSDRQVQRVLGALQDEGHIEVERDAVRAGRNRAPQATLWRLRPDIWPFRTDGRDTDDITINGRDTDDVTIANSPMVATQMPNGGDTLSPPMAMVATQMLNGGDKVSPEPRNKNPVTPVNPVRGTPRTSVRAPDFEDAETKTTTAPLATEYLSTCPMCFAKYTGSYSDHICAVQFGRADRRRATTTEAEVGS